MVSATSLILAGDVMTGRGIDQILASPGSPRLREEYVVDARSYVDLAEDVNGPIPRPVENTWPWGEALTAMDEVGPAVRVMNLETSVTRSEEAAPGKGVHYRMSPANLGCLAEVRADVWTLAKPWVRRLLGLVITVAIFVYIFKPIVREWDAVSARVATIRWSRSRRRRSPATRPRRTQGL